VKKTSRNKRSPKENARDGNSREIEGVIGGKEVGGLGTANNETAGWKKKEGTVLINDGKSTKVERHLRPKQPKSSGKSTMWVEKKELRGKVVSGFDINGEKKKGTARRCWGGGVGGG